MTRLQKKRNLYALTGTAGIWIFICILFSLFALLPQKQVYKTVKITLSETSTPKITEKKQEAFLNAKQQFFLAQFYRSTDTIEETPVRKLADTIKTKGYVKGLLFASSDFSHAAQVFADSRPLALIPKDTLESLFRKAGSKFNSRDSSYKVHLRKTGT